MKTSLREQVKHAKLWPDNFIDKYRYTETNLIFTLVDDLIYIYDIDDKEESVDLLRKFTLREVLEMYHIPLDLFQEDFKGWGIDSWCSMRVYDVDTLEEV